MDTTGREPLPCQGPKDVPDGAGLSFKSKHAAPALGEQPRVAWFEVHPENYMVAGGERRATLEALRRDYPLSLHGVALSLGGAERLDRDHLRGLRALIDRFEPGLVSEHIAWSAWNGVYFADLLPAPLNAEALEVLCDNIDEAQEALCRTILIENPAHYLTLPCCDIPEPEFLATVARRTGCGLLVDVNNVHVSAVNVGVEAGAWLDALPGELIGEIHLAGFTPDPGTEGRLLIDTHGAAVSDEVWRLFHRLIRRIGPRPTLVEWDTDVPEWPVLLAEALKAEARLNAHRPVEAAQ